MIAQCNRIVPSLKHWKHQDLATGTSSETLQKLQRMSYKRNYRANLDCETILKVFRGDCSLLVYWTNLCGFAAPPAPVKGLLGCLTSLWISAIPAYIAHVTLLSQSWEVAKGVTELRMTHTSHPIQQFKNICSWFIFPIFKEATELHIIIFFNTLNRPST